MSKGNKSIPQVMPFRPLDFPDFSRIELGNGIPVYILRSEDYDVMKLEINFPAGRIFETRGKGVARACAHQLREGAGVYSSEEIAQWVDFYGATLQSSGGMDFARIELYSLCKYMDQLIVYIEAMLRSPEFPENELEGYKKRNLRRLAIDLSKNDIISYRTLTEELFGKDHPYGYNSVGETIQQLHIENLWHHFTDNYSHTPSLILAGGIDDQLIWLLEKHLGSIEFHGQKARPDHTVVQGEKGIIELPGPQKFQSSVRLGRRLFNRSHPDYPAMYVLNTILGGYFGSRLMSNIREEKGLTYDIYSSLDMLWLDGYLMIGAEVDPKNVELTLKEIYREFDKLKEIPISMRELKLVKNYINGNLLNLMNGPFNSIELLRLFAIYEQDMSFFRYFMNEVHQISSERLSLMAQKYLNKEDFTIVVVGG